MNLVKAGILTFIPACVAVALLDRLGREVAVAQNIPMIDLLKIDTEGHEIQVLTGARGMLKGGNIAVVKAEVAVDPDMDYHTSFFSLAEFLAPLGYRLFGIYDQCPNEFSPGPRIRRFDACFISGALVARHSSGPWIPAPSGG